MELKNLVFYLAIFFFFFRFNPYFPYHLPLFEYAYFIGYVSGAYIAAFLIHEFIMNYERIKEILANSQNSLSVKLVEKSTNQKKDFIKFFVLSILIFLGIDVIFTKISNQSIFQYFVKYVPGLNETLGLISLKAETIDPSVIFKESGFSLDPKFGNVKEGIGVFIGPMLGAMILFTLRQLNNRSKSLKENKHPGARILLVFLIVSILILVIDLSRDKEFSENILTAELENPPPEFAYLIGSDSDLLAAEIKGENVTKSSDDSIVRYELEYLLSFLIKLSLSATSIISIISIWFFDWYFFSRLWVKK